MYEKQIWSTGRSSALVNKIISVEQAFCLPKDEGDSKPMTYHHPSFSRFIVTILEKHTDTNKTFTPHANIPVGDWADIYEKYCFAKNQGLLFSCQNKAATSSNSTAFDNKFIVGKWKGRNPGEILSSQPEAKDDLLKQIDFLEQNAQKFKNNRLLIKSINDAIKDMSDGNLDGKGAFTPIVIYKGELKPLRTKNKNGKRFIYQMEISCNYGLKSPYTFNIMNAWALVAEGKLSKVDMSTAEDKNSYSFSLTEREMSDCIRNMKRNLEHFEMINAKKQFDKMDKMMYHYE